MSEDPKKHDQFDGDEDANKGGGATTDRGGRDIGQPGPDPNAAAREREHGRRDERGKHEAPKEK
ncbi:hypothetical protein [Paludisphaera mucosa]|uniref:Stress-induced protein n=1 Tax=Paludisphaera mucosa TaxID=3030827 RepID=A0ABT6FC74_9BACT|nr:hypothetical protein [Paludisphaera mucosa]MDG3005135.1 hypothetical protein [Paludisphaera mucosa]